ncbi:hypothetical protein [Arsenicibacter rosenii]|uniref:hypothetical protein n=1 Tax=Arsenicibacter rosenii TaxID=1750698 RepID=UPI001C42F0C8|nr:hypothetical protein [Arsenicibacter rosenii]
MPIGKATCFISRFYVANPLLHLDPVSQANQYIVPTTVAMPIRTHPGYDQIRDIRPLPP